MADRPRMVITGGGGKLAHELVAVLAEEYAVTALTRRQLDITDDGAVRRVVWEYQPAVLVNAAAYTDVDGAERDRDTAFSVNAEGARNVAAAARECGARLVHFSTDYVFDGASEVPYVETDLPNPRTVYGLSKLAGERLVQESLPEALIVRVAWLYGRVSPNLVTQLVSQSRRAGAVFPAPVDAYGCPTWARDVAVQLRALLPGDDTGLFHMTARPEASRYEFVMAVVQALGLRIEIRGCAAAEFRPQTPRPRRSSLRNARLEALGINMMPEWRDGLAAFLSRHREDLL